LQAVFDNLQAFPTIWRDFPIRLSKYFQFLNIFKSGSGGASGVASSASVILDHEYMPLYVPSPSSRGHRSAGSAGQLMRIWFAIPSHCEAEIKIRPLVTPGRNAPTFRTTPEDITLTTNAVWVLRFPYVYRDETDTYFAPKETADFIHYKVSKILSPKSKKG